MSDRQAESIHHLCKFAVMEHFRTNIAIIPKRSPLENVFVLVLVAFIFIPLAIGIFIEHWWLFLSLPIGLFALFVFNLANKGKFVPKNWVQKESFIEFNLTGIKILSRSQQLEFPWATLVDLHLRIAGYDGETHHRGDDQTDYNGTENTISFKAQNVTYDFHFYLKNAEQKEALASFLKKKELEAPKDAHLTVRSQQGTYDADLSGYKKEAPKPEPKASKTTIGCVILFLTPFVLVGLGTLGFATYQFGKVLQARDWKPVSATVRSLEWISNSDSESTTYTIKIEYDYSFETKSFTGNTVSFNSGMNNIEHYRPLYDKLDRSKVIQIYVNENDPAESVVIRGVTNAIIGLLMFSFMWNSIIMIFVLPMIFKRIKMKTLVWIMVVIWVSGACKFIFHIGDINISEQAVVIEEKGDVVSDPED
jgi:hypothetical protein